MGSVFLSAEIQTLNSLQNLNQHFSHFFFFLKPFIQYFHRSAPITIFLLLKKTSKRWVIVVSKNFNSWWVYVSFPINRKPSVEEALCFSLLPTSLIFEISYENMSYLSEVFLNPQNLIYSISVMNPHRVRCLTNQINIVQFPDAHRFK